MLSLKCLRWQTLNCLSYISYRKKKCFIIIYTKTKNCLVHPFYSLIVQSMLQKNNWSKSFLTPHMLPYHICITVCMISYAMISPSDTNACKCCSISYISHLRMKYIVKYTLPFLMFSLQECIFLRHLVFFHIIFLSLYVWSHMLRYLQVTLCLLQVL